jgi:glyoxylase-like metal-dependent hydrolase (beta-lactamase superfamily II)
MADGSSAGDSPNHAHTTPEWKTLSVDAHEVDFGRLLIRRNSGGRLLLPVGPCLLRLESRVVLVDAGFDPGLAERVDGVDWQPPQRTTQEQLEALGLTPDDVSDVVLTHLHDDHGGGVFDRVRGEAVYPNARLHVQELALWRGLDRVARGGERFVSPELLEWLLTHPLTVLHQGDWRLCGSLAVWHTGGHTPGHQVALAGEGQLAWLGEGDSRHLAWEPGPDGGRGDLLLGGDLLSLKACLHPDFRTSSDVEPERARERRADLATAVGAGLACWLYHGSAGRRVWRT